MALFRFGKINFRGDNGLESKVNRKERVFFLIGLVPVFWLCFKMTGKVTQEQADFFTNDVAGSLIEFSPLFIFYSGLISTIFYLVLYIFLYLVQLDNIHVFKLPLNEWEDQMYHMVIIGSILTLILSTFFCFVAVFIIEKSIYNGLVLLTIGIVSIVCIVIFRRILSETKIKEICKHFGLYILTFFVFCSFAIGILSPAPHITIETRFGSDGKVKINTRSNEKIKHVRLQILTGDKIKVAEQKVRNFRTSGFYQTDKRKFDKETKQKEESRTYKINLADYKKEVLPMKKYFARIIFEIEDERYLLINEFFINNKKFYYNENIMKYEYKD